jgi:hypothetical protein
MSSLLFFEQLYRDHNRNFVMKNHMKGLSHVLFRTRNLGQHFLDISKKMM